VYIKRNHNIKYEAIQNTGNVKEVKDFITKHSTDKYIESNYFENKCYMTFEDSFGHYVIIEGEWAILYGSEIRVLTDSNFRYKFKHISEHVLKEFEVICSNTL